LNLKELVAGHCRSIEEQSQCRETPATGGDLLLVAKFLFSKRIGSLVTHFRNTCLMPGKENPLLFNHKAQWRDGDLLIMMHSTLVFRPVG
jgi:hypothetical protein